MSDTKTKMSIEIRIESENRIYESVEHIELELEEYVLFDLFLNLFYENDKFDTVSFV